MSDTVASHTALGKDGERMTKKRAGDGQDADLVDSLYAAPPRQFVAERKRVRDALVAAGRADEAREVAKRKRPSASVWAVNQLARRAADEIDELLELGASLRAGERKLLRGGDAGEFMEEARTARQKVAALARRAELIVEGGIVSIDGHDVTRAIRTPELDKIASAVARLPRVREVLVARQREIGLQGGVVMEGRDIGTQVFPDAEVKVFLDASPEVRGSRRFLQNQSGAPGKAPLEAAIVEEMKERDRRDRNRATSPLKPADDAVVIDSTSLTLDQVIQRVEQIIEEKLAAKK